MSCKESCGHSKQGFSSHEQYLDYHRKWRAKNSEQIRVSAIRRYYLNRDKILAGARSHRRARWENGGREYHCLYMRQYRKRIDVKIKDLARQAVHAAVASGKLIKENCMVCGDGNSHAHHPDYACPLEVLWFCPAHHAELHRK